MKFGEELKLYMGVSNVGRSFVSMDPIISSGIPAFDKAFSEGVPPEKITQVFVRSTPEKFAPFTEPLMKIGGSPPSKVVPDEYNRP